MPGTQQRLRFTACFKKTEYDVDKHDAAVVGVTVATGGDGSGHERHDEYYDSEEVLHKCVE